MKKHLFITGPSGIGKSTLLRQELGSALSYAGGFITERMLAEDGKLLGYDLFPAAAAVLRDSFEGRRFLDYSVTPPTHDNEVFREDGVRPLEQSLYYPFVFLDEIGGFELLVPQFRHALEDVLNAELPVIGVLKEAAGADKLRRRLGLSERFSMTVDNLHAMLGADDDTVVLTMRERGDEVVRRIVSQWVKEYAVLPGGQSI